MAAQATVNASTEAEITETFWPSLWKTLSNDPSGMDRLNLNCMVCFERMTAKDEERGSDQEDQHLHHGARILPCGHMIGYKCIHDHFTHAREAYRCPLCRTSLEHRACQHPHLGVQMHQAVQSPHLLPLNKAEGRSVLPRLCADCRVLSLSQGWNNILESMEEDVEFKLAENEYLALSVRQGGTLWAVGNHDGMKVRDVEMPEWLLEDCQKYAERLTTRSQNLWRTMELQPLSFGLHVYEQKSEQSCHTEQGYHYLQSEQDRQRPGGRWFRRLFSGR